MKFLFCIVIFSCKFVRGIIAQNDLYVNFFAFLFARKETLAKKRAKGTTDENLLLQIFTRFPLWKPLSADRVILSVAPPDPFDLR